MKKFDILLKGAFILSLTIASVSCSEDDDPSKSPGDQDGNSGNNRLPQAVVDQTSYTASYMIDTDLDGDDDIILGPANGPVSDMLLINNGNGFFEIKENAFPVRYRGIDGQTVNITSADFNNDGWPDVITTTIDGREATFSQSAQIHLYLNNGGNSFLDASPQIIDNFFEVGWVEWIRIGDFNNDGYMDFVTTAPGGFDMNPNSGVFQGGYIYLNDGNAHFQRAQIRMNDMAAIGEYTYKVLAWDAGAGGELDRFPLDIFAGDVDNDGDTDLVAPNGYAGGRWVTFVNVSAGTEASFQVLFNGNQNSDPWDEIVFKNGNLMDINGDGFLDVIGSSSIGDATYPALVETFLNNGQGQFSETSDLISGTTPNLIHARQWLVADFNNDSKDDLFVADHGSDFWPFPGNPNLLLLNAGNTLANNSSGVGTKSAFTHGAAVGDIDNDGNLDLFMNNHQGLEAIGGGTADYFIYLNNGAGVFKGSQ